MKKRIAKLSCGHTAEFTVSGNTADIDAQFLHGKFVCRACHAKAACPCCGKA